MSHDFGAEYQAKLTTIADAMRQVQPGMRVVASMAASEPQEFLHNLSQFSDGLKDVEVYCANPSKDYSCFSDAKMVGHVEMKVLFLTAPVRRNQGRGMVHYIPQHLSQWVQNILRAGPIDLFWGSATRPDERGFVSLGPNVCYEYEILRAAKKVILETNPRMPTTFGSTHLPLSWVDQFIEVDHSMPTLQSVEPDAIDYKIAEHVASLIEDGSTIQLGIGAIPNAVGKALKSKKDLGVHTELINDAILELYHTGAITGKNKSLWPGKIVGSFVLGTQELYDFCHDNPIVHLEPSSVVNDPYRIGRNTKMTSVNSAVEIDLTGQVCSESVGHRELSGVGGATDTHVGAQRSAGGRGIVALRSAAKNSQSKIVFELKPGAKVSISRNDVDTIITEHGIAELKGRSVAERVHSLIAIAPVEAREELRAQATAANYL